MATTLLSDNVPERAACNYCGRQFAKIRLERHRQVCAQSLKGFRASVEALDGLDGGCRPAGREADIYPAGRRAPKPQVNVDVPLPRAADCEAKANATAIDGDEDSSEALSRCHLCGRRFAHERLLQHRRACAMTLSDFRAQVAALDECDREEVRLATLTRRLTLAEAKLAEERALAADATRRAEMAEAAASSIEAAHDVVADALAQSEAREAAHRKRADAAEAALQDANRRAEVAETAAKSMEAAYDVMAEALEDSEKKVEALRAAAQ